MAQFWGPPPGAYRYKQTQQAFDKMGQAIEQYGQRKAMENDATVLSQVLEPGQESRLVQKRLEGAKKSATGVPTEQTAGSAPLPSVTEELIGNLDKFKTTQGLQAAQQLMLKERAGKRERATERITQQGKLARERVKGRRKGDVVTIRKGDKTRQMKMPADRKLFNQRVAKLREQGWQVDTGEQQEQWGEITERGGMLLQKQQDTNKFRKIGKVQKGEDYGEPFEKNGMYVQKNLNTGELEKIGDIPGAGGAGAGAGGEELGPKIPLYHPRKGKTIKVKRYSQAWKDARAKGYSEGVPDEKKDEWFDSGKKTLGEFYGKLTDQGFEIQPEKTEEYDLALDRLNEYHGQGKVSTEAALEARQDATEFMQQMEKIPREKERTFREDTRPEGGQKVIADLLGTNKYDTRHIVNWLMSHRDMTRQEAIDYTKEAAKMRQTE